MRSEHDVIIEWRTSAEIPSWVKELAGMRKQLGYALVRSDGSGRIVVLVDEVAKFSRKVTDKARKDLEEMGEKVEGDDERAFIRIFCRTITGTLIEELAHVFMKTLEEREAVNATLALLRAATIL